MKILLAAHGYPPELVGGTESAVRSLAHALARAGVDVAVCAGSLDCARGFRTSESSDPCEGGRPVRVHRIHRADPYFDHWHKSRSAAAGRAFRELLRRERPDAVHVHHWIRLTRDLVAIAASEGIPAVVTLHDLWSTCLIAFRVRPDTKRFCSAPLAPDPCLACAGSLPPRTPWVAREQGAEWVGEHRADLLRELTLARAVLVPSRTHGEVVARSLGADALRFQVVPLARELRLARRAPPRPPAEIGRVVLGAWGHLARHKGPDLLLDAVRRTPDPQRFELHLAGGDADPDFARDLRARARGLAVRFHGAYEAEALATHEVSAGHAMASATRAWESYGFVLDEAVMLGLPCVLPRAGALPERAGSGWALFFESSDADGLARALWRLWSEPELLPRLRAALPEPDAFVAAQDRFVERHLEVYRACIEAGAPPVEAAGPEAETSLEERERKWAEELGRRSPSELGFTPAGEPR